MNACDYCARPEAHTDEAVAAMRGETVDQWRTFRDVLPQVPDDWRPGDVIRFVGGHTATLVCIHRHDYWTDRGAYGYHPNQRRLDAVQLDLFGAPPA